MPTSPKLVLMTGAAGKVGAVLRPALAQHYRLRMVDHVPVPGAPDALVGDINDDVLLDRAMSDVDAVIHLAGRAQVNADFAALLDANIRGTYSVYEAARRNGVRRVVFASTHHTIANYSPLPAAPTATVWNETALDPVRIPFSPRVPVRTDSLYGASKAFGEALATYYADWHAVTSVCLRLGSVTPDPASPYLGTPRAWALWMSARDLCELFRCAVDAEGVGCALVYGCSRNTRRWWDLEHARDLIGFVAQDDSEQMIPEWYRDGLVPPAPSYPLPWGERLAALPVRAGHAMLVWIGQSGFFLKTAGGLKLAIDPFLSVWPDRLQAPLLAAGDLPVDCLLITHTHRDHLDVHALPAVAQARPQAQFIAPPTACAKLLELGIAPARIIALRPGESHSTGDSVVTAIPARHQDSAPDAQGYVVRTGNVALYHTGDSEYDASLLEARGHRPSVLLVPINGRGGNMSAEQAAQLAADLAPQAAIPMHFGCLQPRADLPDRFVAALRQVAPLVAPAVMEHGAILRLPVP